MSWMKLLVNSATNKSVCLRNVNILHETVAKLPSFLETENLASTVSAMNLRNQASKRSTEQFHRVKRIFLARQNTSDALMHVTYVRLHYACAVLFTICRSRDSSRDCSLVVIKLFLSPYFQMLIE